MSAFTSRVDGLLTERKLTRYRFCLDCNIPESSYRSWIKGACPNAEITLKIAQYFNVSVEYLINGSNPPKQSDEPFLSDAENELIEIYRSLDKRGRETLLNLAKALEVKN